jgi:predicted acyl esterase
MYVGAVQGHGGDHSANEDQWHMQFFNDWFFYWLLGLQNGENTAPKYEYASTTLPVLNNWYTFVHDSSTTWPPSGVTKLRLYFNTKNRLTTSPGTSKNSYAQIYNKVSGGLTMQQAVDDEFTGADFNAKFVKNRVYFETAPLAQSSKLLGTPKINLNYSSTCNTFCQYNFQIYEVTPNGTLNFINRINYTDRNYKAKAKRTVNINGQAHSHIFQAGNKIRIVLTNLDTSPYDTTFLATNPFVLPVLINGYNLLYLNNSSYIDIPVSTSFSFGSVTDVLAPETPIEFSLKQNYPNPFNPTTNIKYQIPIDSYVKLSVYNLLGQEVAVLVNNMQKQGEYNVNFNASNLSSGIYFYKLSAGSYEEVKKMILVK